MDFDINEALKVYLNDPKLIQTPEANAEIADYEHDLDSVSAATVAEILEAVSDTVTDNPDALNRGNNFDTLQCILKLASALPGTLVGRLLDMLSSGLQNETDVANQDVEGDDQDILEHHKRLLEMYAFLLQWAISAIEAKANEKSTATVKKTTKGSKKTVAKDGSWDSTAQVQRAMEVMCRVMKIKLNKIFPTTSDRDVFVNMFTRSINVIMESEVRMKSEGVRRSCYKVLCIAIKHNGHALSAQTSIVQNLTYFEHLSEPMAELLHILAEHYDYPQLSAEVISELATKDFSATDTKGPKAVSTFVTKLSEIAPKLVIKELGKIAGFLDSEAYILRCAIIEVCGNLLVFLSRQEEQDEFSQERIDAFFDLLDQRFLDTNPYCRCKAMQVSIKICSLDQKYPKRRQNMAESAIQSLQDKSSNVRRNAVKLLAKLIQTHPFDGLYDGSELTLSEWEARLTSVEDEILKLEPPVEKPEADEGQDDVDSMLLEDATQMQTDSAAVPAPPDSDWSPEKAEMLAKLKLTRKYCIEALQFIAIVHDASEVVVQLLSAKNKSEIVEAMDFFVVADAYKIETARRGIRKMLRLIWTKGNSDEGKGVQAHLIQCYKGLFFDAPESMTTNDKANFIARNMISLTFGASPAELTSLEQLLATMMKEKQVSALVVSKLWQVYGVNKDISRAQRRGAIIVLGMLATANTDIVSNEVEAMLRVLGTLGRRDLGLARFTCIALRRMIQPQKKASDKGVDGMSRLANDHPVLRMLASLLLQPSSSQEWFGMAEQAVSAIYSLSEHPDVLCSEIVRQKTRLTFASTQTAQVISRSPSPQHEEETSNGISDEMEVDGQEVESEKTVEEQLSAKNQPNAAIALSHLLFVVGHIAIKQIVHLELCELEFKRRKQQEDKDKPAPLEAQKTPAPNKKRKAASLLAVQAEPTHEEELALIGGTTEDDFTEAMLHIRDRELLHSQSSLLSHYTPLVVEILTNNTTYPSPTLQAHATLTLVKLMCVSSELCERHLPLLITVLERSPSPIIRSNAVIALGDMAVCFNHLLDENTDFLYRRLQDPDSSVKRTCLMTLTFLILAGQVKVKGQLGAMAKCLEDSDRRIADLAKMFFTELATKDNAVYNQFVDMFSILTQTGQIEGGIMEEEALKRILKFLCGFVEKETHKKALVEKLGARLQRCENERQWSDTAFALGLLAKGNEEVARKIDEGYRIVEAAA